MMNSSSQSLVRHAIDERAAQHILEGIQNKSRIGQLASPATQRSIALERLRSVAQQRLTPQVPDDPIIWQSTVYPRMQLAPPAKRHAELWSWAAALRPGVRPNPFVAIWPRGSGKSTTAEIVSTYLGAHARRFYVWYVSGTQALADLHVESIASLIESPTFGFYYKSMSERSIGKYGNVRGWRRSRLRCGNGFTVDALGLDTGARGSKVEERRPDLIILDDIDGDNDSQLVIDRKIRTITNGILPAGSKDVAILAIQNLISNDGFFGRIANRSADYLSDAILSGPYPAIEDLRVDQHSGRFWIVGGTPTWDGQSLEVCQNQIFSWGYTAFLREAQHDISDTNSMFGHIDFLHCNGDELPDTERTICVVDPAVTDGDNSDSHGIAIASLCDDGRVYHRWQLEQIIGPKESIRIALLKSIEYGVDTIYVEVNQGGQVWRVLYDQLVDELGLSAQAPAFQELKATSSEGGKAERASVMLADYERGLIKHVRGTHEILETALKRFLIRKPYDLVDAAVWAHRKLREGISWVLA
jgi:hypothetical protein